MVVYLVNFLISQSRCDIMMFLFYFSTGFWIFINKFFKYMRLYLPFLYNNTYYQFIEREIQSNIFKILLIEIQRPVILLTLLCDICVLRYLCAVVSVCCGKFWVAWQCWLLNEPRHVVLLSEILSMIYLLYTIQSLSQKNQFLIRTLRNWLRRIQQETQINKKPLEASSLVTAIISWG